MYTITPVLIPSVPTRPQADPSAWPATSLALRAICQAGTKWNRDVAAWLEEVGGSAEVLEGY
jgi:hypothetical protein